MAYLGSWNKLHAHCCSALTMSSQSSCMEQKPGGPLKQLSIRRFLRIRWPDILSNTDLWRETNQIPVEDEIRRRRWNGMEHTLKSTSSVTKQALCWNPQGKRKRGRPRNTYRHDFEVDIRKTGQLWSQLERMAQNRYLWRTVVDGLCPRSSEQGLDRLRWAQIGKHREKKFFILKDNL